MILVLAYRKVSAKLLILVPVVLYLKYISAYLIAVHKLAECLYVCLSVTNNNCQTQRAGVTDQLLSWQFCYLT